MLPSVVLLALFIKYPAEGFVFTLPSHLDKTSVEALKQAEQQLSLALLDEDNISLTKSNSTKVTVLQPLYFHYGEFFMYVSKMRFTSSDFAMEETNLDVLGHEMMPVVSFPWVEVNGKLKTGKMDSAPQRTDFRLVINSLRGKGVISLSADFLNVTWAYFFFHPETSLLEIKPSEDFSSPNLTQAFNLTELGEIFTKKMQREISHELTQIVSNKINQTLKEGPKVENLEALTEEFSEYGINNTENANGFIDSLLEVAGDLIRSKYGDRIKIPDINEGFSEKFLITFRGSFRATDGSAIGTSTVHRNGDVVLNSDNETMLNFYGILGFQQLHLAYNNYKAEIWGFGPSGSMVATFTPISTLVHVNLNLSSRTLTLEKFKIASIGDMDVQLTGLGRIFNWLVSRITTWVLGMFRNKILHQLEAKYQSYGRDVFATYNIEDLLGTSVNEAVIT